ncbi:MAG TPA: hypothetical protein VF622_09295, partial [Segetibacter sp.]
MRRVNHNYLLLVGLFLISCSNNLNSTSELSGKKKDALHCYVPSTRTSQFISTTLQSNNYEVADTSHNGMVWIEGGKFIMGAPDGKGMPNEYPKHTVTV